MPRKTPVTPRQYADREVLTYQKYIKMHRGSLGNVKGVLALSDFFADAAIVAATSAATMGLAGYLSTTTLATRFGTWMAGFAGTTGGSAGTTVATFTRSSAALRTIARVATASTSGSGSALTAAQIEAAYTGIAARVTAGLAVGMTNSCVQRGLSGKRFSATFFGTAVVENLLLSVLLGWAGSPGRTATQVQLSERLSLQLAGWRHLATSRPSNQCVASGVKLSWATLKKIIGPGGIDDLDKELKKSKSSISKAMEVMADKTAKEIHYLALEAWAKIEASIRARQRRIRSSREISFTAQMGHAIREVVTGDARISYRVDAERTELAVSVAGRDFWNAVSKRLQDLHVAKKYSLKRLK